MTARIASFLIWAAVLAGAVAWGLPLFTRGTPVPAGASLATPAPPVGAGLSRLLGQAPVAPVAEAPAPVADSRFQLLGVVAPRRGSGASTGLALISVDGKPARAWGVGREVEPGLRLLTVGHREVQLGAGAGAPSVTLTLPPLAEAQRGRPGELAGGQPPGLVPGAVSPGGAFPSAGYPAAPAPMRVPPLPAGQQQPVRAVPVLPPVAGGVQPQANGAPANLPYQPDGGQAGGEQAAGQPGSVNPMR